MLRITASFPADNPEFQNAINNLCDKMVEMREILVGKNLISKASEEQVFEVLGDVEKEIVTGTKVIAATLQIGEDNNIHLAERLEKLIGCVRGCLRGGK